MDTVYLFTWLTLRTDPLAPARFVVLALVGLLGARWARRRGAALALAAHKAWRLRAWGAPARGSLDELAEGAPAVLRGTLALLGDRLFLRTDDGLVELTDPCVAEDEAARLDGVALRRFAREGAEAAAKGVVRRERDDHTPNYRARGQRVVLGPGADAVRVAILRDVPGAALHRRAVALGALLGGLLGLGLPFVVVPLVAPARCAPRFFWRVGSIMCAAVQLDPIAERTSTTCAVTAGLLGPWWPAAMAQPPAVVVRDRDEFASFRQAHEVAPVERARERELWMALGDFDRVLDHDLRHGDALILRGIARAAWARGDHRVLRRALLLLLARTGRLGELLPLVPAAYLPDAPDWEDPAALVALPEVPPAAAEMLRCLRAAHVPPNLSPVRWQPDAAEARALLGRPEPACRIFGALAPTERNDAALAALSALPRTSPIWRPLIDAARNVITLEGVVSGRVHVEPGRSDAYGDPEEQRATLTPGIAMQIERLGELAQQRGHLWLVDRARFPALEVLGEAYHGAPWRSCWVNFRDSPLFRQGTDRPVDARWVYYLNEGYRLAVASFEDAQRRDPRFNDAWRRRLLAGRERAQIIQDQNDFWQGVAPGGGPPWGLRRDTWSGVRGLRFGGIDESTGRPDPNLDVAQVERVTRALYRSDRPALLAALGPRNRASMRVATIAWSLASNAVRSWLAAWAAPPLDPQVGALRLRRYDREGANDGRGRTPPHELWGVASDPAHQGALNRDDLGDLDLDDPFAAAMLDLLQRDLLRAARPAR